MIGSFFEGPLMAAYGAQFGAAPAGAAGFGGVANLPLSLYVACHPTLTCTNYQCHSLQIPCLTRFCTLTVVQCSLACVTPPFASTACQVGVGGAVQGQAAMAAPAAAAQMLPSLVCSYAPHCWFSYGACPTMFGCGPSTRLAVRRSRHRRQCLPPVLRRARWRARTHLTAGIAGTRVPRCMAAVHTIRRAARSSRRRPRIPPLRRKVERR